MPIATRMFRVFVSSTFEDLKEERDALQRNVFPKLRTLCEQHGARFQAIDLRWGVRDEAALDQQTIKICFREIQRCRATGVRPNFIALLGDRYGWQPLPATIPAAEFDALKPHLAARAERWYRRDENAIPPEYCLQPRSGEFVEPSTWNPIEETLLQALAMAARAAGLPGKELIKYEASATHQEILAGLGDREEDRQHVFAFVRRPTENADARLEGLKSHLRVHEFDPGDMTALCDFVLTSLRQVIEAEVKRFEDRPAIDLEIEAHDRFAEDRSRIFIGRDAVLKMIADYVSGPERRSLVLHGESGSGKSAVMARASQQYKGSGRVIRRFIGASPESASGHALLTSLCRQIAPGETPVDYAQLENAFRERLSVATAEQPLVLFIDALDQLAASDPARDVTWLPPELPPHVKVIVSTNDDAEPLPAGLPVHLERMAQQEAGQALDELLREAHRALQSWQRETVLAHFERCGLPLYLKLAAEESRLWKSYTPEDACVLGEGVAGVIDTLFDRLASNANHGPTLVEHSLGYLAAGRYGLTEDEILDVLTADDIVWNDFDKRKRHEVSERRLPVVVWSRLSLDLEPYLTERAAPGGTVIAFYHRQLGEAVAERYLGGEADMARHRDLSMYFKAKPLRHERGGEKVPNLRKLSELPFQQACARQRTELEDTLTSLEFVGARIDAFGPQAAVEDYGLALEPTQPGLSAPPFKDETLLLLRGAIRLSANALASDPSQLRGQLLGRLLANKSGGVRAILEKAKSWQERQWLRPIVPSLEAPNTGLTRIFAGHSSRIHSIAVTRDGSKAVSGSLDTTLKVWDLDTGQCLRTLHGHSRGIESVVVTDDGRQAVSVDDCGTIKVWDIRTGSSLGTVEGRDSLVHALTIAPDGRHFISGRRTLHVWRLPREAADLANALSATAFEVGLKLGGEDIHCVAAVPGGDYIVTGGERGSVQLLNLNSGEIIRRFDGHRSCVEGVVVTSDAECIISAGRDGTVRVWRLATGDCARVLRAHEEWVLCVALTSDGECIVSGSGDVVGKGDNSVRVWRRSTGEMLGRFVGHTGPVTALAVVPNGNIVSGSWDGTVRQWSMASRNASIGPDGHSKTVYSIAATQSYVVSGSYDKTVLVSSLDTGKALHTLEGHNEGVYAVAVTPDGAHAISGSYDKTVRVWSLMSGKLVRVLEGCKGPVRAVAVTPDGQFVIAGGDSDAICIFALVSGKMRIHHMNTSDRRRNWHS